jgi:hypothetical protein
MDSRVVLRLQSVFPFTSRWEAKLLRICCCPLKRRRFRRPSPHHRVAGPFRQWLIGSAYRPSDGVGHHRLWHGTIVSRRQRVAPAWSASGIPQHRWWGERFGLSSALHPRAVTGAPSRPKTPSPEVTLPGPYVTPPPPEPPVATRWLLSSSVIGEFEQGVLYGCGPAQVGFGDRLSSFHRLTVSSRGKLSPEPLRLTRPEGAKQDSPGQRPRCTTQVASLTHTWGCAFCFDAYSVPRSMASWSKPVSK